MAKETILNRGGSSAIDCILPFAWNCAIGVSTQYFEIFMANNEQPQVTPERLSGIQKRANSRSAGTVATTAGNKILTMFDGSLTIPNMTVIL